MRLGTIGLPECVCVVITELLDAVADFSRGEGPYGLGTDLTTSLVVCGRSAAVDIG